MISAEGGDQEDTRYLGSWSNETPRCYSTMSKITAKVDERVQHLTACALPLRCKIRALTEWVSSSANYVLMNERIQDHHIKQLQSSINGAIRDWCNLPHNSSVQLLTLPVEMYGLNIPNFERIYRKMICMKANYLLKEVDFQAKLIIGDSLRRTVQARGLQFPADREFFGREGIRSDRDIWTFWEAVHETTKKWGSWNGDVVAGNINEGLMQQAEARPHQGQLIRSWNEAHVSQTRVVRKWLREVTDHHLKFYIKASLQLLYTPAYKRMIHNVDGNCVCGQLGTQMHILNDCPARRGDMVRRHNRVQNALLSKVPRRPNDIVFTDSHVGSILCRGSNVRKDKPDVVIINHRLREFSIIEVSVPYDRRLREAEREKIDKYRPLVDAIAANYRGYNVKFVPIIVGALGGMMGTLKEYLELVGIEEWWDQREVRVRMRKAAIGGSFDIWAKKSAIGGHTSTIET